MTYRTGQHGEMFIKNTNITTAGSLTKIGSVRDWNINFQQEPIDTTCLQDFDKTSTKGLRSFTGGGTLLYYEPATGDSSFKTFLNNFLSTSSQQVGPDQADWGHAASAGPEYVRMRLGLSTAGSGNDTEIFEFYALITGFQVTCSVGEVVSGAFTFTGTGPLVDNTF